MSPGQQQRHAEVGLEVPNRTQLPAVDDLLHPRGQRVVAVVESLDENPTGLHCCGGHLPGFFRIRGQWLLAEHVLSRAQRSDRPLGMKTVGEWNVDCIDFRILDQRVVRFVKPRYPLLLSEGAGSGRVACGHGNHADLRHRARRPDDGHRGDARSTEHSDPQRGVIRHVETRCPGRAKGVIPVRKPLPASASSQNILKASRRDGPSLSRHWAGSAG